MRPRALIAEDEPVLRKGLEKLLAEVWPELDIVAVAEDGVQATRLLEQHQPQVLFLDIQMPGLTGLEVAKAASGRCHIVFVTGHDQYAVAAFEHGAVDYVMKPFNAARLQTACMRVKARLNTSPANLDRLLEQLAEVAAKKRAYLRWINVATGDKVRLVTVEEICYFRAETKYTTVVTAESEMLIRTPLKDLAEELDPEMFWQIHRSTIVNVDAIAEVTHYLHGRLKLHLKERSETLIVSQPHAHLFHQM
jgi:DNA-binding LytR/AlgR family response regulator